MVAPHRNLLLMWSRMAEVLASPTSVRKVLISARMRFVRLIRPHLEQCDDGGIACLVKGEVRLALNQDLREVAIESGPRIWANVPSRRPGWFGCLSPMQEHGWWPKRRPGRSFASFGGGCVLPWSSFNGGGISSEQGGVKLKKKAEP